MTVTTERDYERPGYSRCIRCGLSGYDIAPRYGRRRKDGSVGRRIYCRFCLADPEFKSLPSERRLRHREAMRRKRAREYAERASRLVAITVLGPCPCQRCHERVIWDGYYWRNVVGGRQHNCSAIYLRIA